MLTMNHRIAGTLLVSAALLLQPLAAHAGIVSTEQITAAQSTAAERARVEAFVDRASAAGKLRALGVDAALAKDRVAALSDTEVHGIAARIDALPAGAGIGGFSDEQVIIVLLLLILVAVIAS